MCHKKEKKSYLYQVHSICIYIEIKLYCKKKILTYLTYHENNEDRVPNHQ